MTSLSEAYVNYCISTEGLELDNNLAEVFTQESSSTIDGFFFPMVIWPARFSREPTTIEKMHPTLDQSDGFV